MGTVIDQLEERVGAVGDLVQKLRREIARLERELADRPHLPASIPPPPPDDDRLLGEIARLRAEREAVRERIAGLIKEIDQVNW